MLSFIVHHVKLNIMICIYDYIPTEPRELDTYVFECPESYYKCPGNYCIPYRYICDGDWHCPGGEDEMECGK